MLMSRGRAAGKFNYLNPDGNHAQIHNMHVRNLPRHRQRIRSRRYPLYRVLQVLAGRPPRHGAYMIEAGVLTKARAVPVDRIDITA